MIVRGRNAGTPEESEEKSLIGTSEIGSEGLGGFETKRLLANILQFPEGPFLDLGGLLPGEIAGFELLSHVAES